MGTIQVLDTGAGAGAPGGGAHAHPPEDTNGPLASVALAPLALALAACGGGGGGGGGGVSVVPAGSPTPTPAPPVVVVAPPPTAAQASRFLAQATAGATRSAIDAVVADGYAKWLDAQLAMPRTTSFWDWLVANGYAVAANNGNAAGFDAAVWSQLVTAPDQLRQRVGLALLDFLVVGVDGVNLSWRQFATAAYLDVLWDGAFGSFRDLLGAITTNAAMGSFLTFLNNRKANPQTGAQPDENYARELMQLFTLGLYQLNMDGTPKLSGGQPIETYTQADVTQLARVFTGLQLASSDNGTPDRMRQPMVMNAGMHETGGATFLGIATAGGDGNAQIKAALDGLFAHPNVAPFVAKQLIQRLVSSNPTPAYVGRVAAVFANNGQGARGDLKAVVRAILLDPEARGDAGLASASAGKLREPVLRLTGWARAFGAASPSNAWAIGDTSSPTGRLGQSPGRAPSVFGFFRPGYAPPATAIASAAMVSPEFQLVNEQSVIGYVNYMYQLVANGTGDVKADYAAILAKAGDSAALVDEVNLLLAAGQLSPATVAAIRGAVDSIAATATGGPLNRVGVAIVLTLASPDYLTLR
jgi:uncharacterized protein (DUF1800 family)